MAAPEESSELFGFPTTQVLAGVGVGVLVAGAAVKALGTPAPAKVLDRPPTFHETSEHKPQYKDGPFHSTRRDWVADIRFAKTGIASKEASPPMTLPQMFAAAAERHGSKPAMRVERPLGPEPKKGETPEQSKPVEEWKTWTFQEYYAESRVAARAFKALGLKKFQAVNIWGFNAPEWFMGEMGAILAGGIAAGIYPTDTPAQVKFKAEHSGAAIAVVEDDKKKDIILKMKLPELKAIIVWSPSKEMKPTEVDGIMVASWANLKDIAAKFSESDLDSELSQIHPGHVCTYIYTSGTTGNPKAVMITHDNLLYETRVVLDMLDFMSRDGEEERIISYLPLSHVAGMMVDIVCPMVMAATRTGWCTAHFARPYDLRAATIGDRLRAVQPTLFLGVPRVWEKICEKMKAMVAANPPTGLKLHIARWAKSKGLEHQLNCQLGGSGAKGFGYGFADRAVLSMVKSRLGLDKCKFAFTGAAPITTETLEYFGALGIQINEVYGMSECTGAATWSLDEAHIWGSCGWTVPGTEVKIFACKDGNINDKVECPKVDSFSNIPEEAQGEICYRGRHIMAGYMANPALGEEHVKEIEQKNAGAIDEEGWLHSGDKGCMTKDGMVKVTGRYKELIIGAGGENIAPVPIEDAVKKQCGAVSNVMMVGDKRKFMVALVTLKAKGATGELPGGDELDNEAATLVPGVTKVSEAIKSQEFAKKVEEAFIAVNKDEVACPSNAAKVQKFMILPADFSVTTEEFTPTLKLKRSVVADKYNKQIESMYKSKDVYVQYQA